jgi:type IV pilus assembly protein PilN
MRITLNLATRPFTDLGPAMKRLRIAIGVLALVSLGLLLGLHFLHQKAEEARAREHSLDGDIARITSERQGYQNMMQRPENASFMVQVANLNQLFDEKSFSWTLAMENLETVLPGGVQVTQIDPERAKLDPELAKTHPELVRNQKITLHLRVVGPHDLAVELVRNLEHSSRFMTPRIVGENAETTNRSPNRQLEPVSASNRFDFDILADYNPPAPDQRKTSAKTEQEQAPSEGDTGNPPPPAHRVPGFRQEKARGSYTGAPPPQPAPIPRGYHVPANGGPQ